MNHSRTSRQPTLYLLDHGDYQLRPFKESIPFNLEPTCRESRHISPCWRCVTWGFNHSRMSRQPTVFLLTTVTINYVHLKTPFHLTWSLYAERAVTYRERVLIVYTNRIVANALALYLLLLSHTLHTLYLLLTLYKHFKIIQSNRKTFFFFNKIHSEILAKSTAIPCNK